MKIRVLSGVMLCRVVTVKKVQRKDWDDEDTTTFRNVGNYSSVYIT